MECFACTSALVAPVMHCLCAWSSLPQHVRMGAQIHACLRTRPIIYHLELAVQCRWASFDIDKIPGMDSHHQPRSSTSAPVFSSPSAWLAFLQGCRHSRRSCGASTRWCSAWPLCTSSRPRRAPWWPSLWPPCFCGPTSTPHDLQDAQLMSGMLFFSLLQTFFSGIAEMTFTVRPHPFASIAAGR